MQLLSNSAHNLYNIWRCKIHVIAFKQKPLSSILCKQENFAPIIFLPSGQRAIQSWSNYVQYEVFVIKLEYGQIQDKANQSRISDNKTGQIQSCKLYVTLTIATYQ